MNIDVEIQSQIEIDLAISEKTKGADGADGADGEGVPTGGETGQVLTKASNDDFDTEWTDQQSGGGGGESENSISGGAYQTPFFGNWFTNEIGDASRIGRNFSPNALYCSGLIFPRKTKITGITFSLSGANAEIESSYVIYKINEHTGIGEKVYESGVLSTISLNLVYAETLTEGITVDPASLYLVGVSLSAVNSFNCVEAGREQVQFGSSSFNITRQSSGTAFGRLFFNGTQYAFDVSKPQEIDLNEATVDIRPPVIGYRGEFAE